MINYRVDRWGLSLLFKCGGSVFPKSFTVALPSAVLAGLLHLAMHGGFLNAWVADMEGMQVMWAGYTTVLGFLVVFRNNQAYTRFWEGATIINQVRGEWFNAVSCLVAFCSKDEEKKEKVQVFQHTLVRLASLLYCFALQQICDLDDDALEIIRIDTMDKNSIQLLAAANDKVELVVQWMQRLIVESDAAGTLQVPPPILSRAFQELSRGIVKLNEVRKISEIPFPFPYAQTLTTMLALHWIMTPLMSAHVVGTAWCASAMTFLLVAAYWSLFYIATELDQPFGEDNNDLPIKEMQKDFNRSILVLLNTSAQQVPTFNLFGGEALTRTSLTECSSKIAGGVMVGRVPWESHQRRLRQRTRHMESELSHATRQSQHSAASTARLRWSLFSTLSKSNSVVDHALSDLEDGAPRAERAEGPEQSAEKAPHPEQSAQKAQSQAKSVDFHDFQAPSAQQGGSQSSNEKAFKTSQTSPIGEKYARGTWPDEGAQAACSVLPGEPPGGGEAEREPKPGPPAERRQRLEAPLPGGLPQQVQPG